MKKTVLLHELIKSGESQALEFKTSFDRETIETVVAFANTHGGEILIGVTELCSYVSRHCGKVDVLSLGAQIKPAAITLLSLRKHDQAPL